MWNSYKDDYWAKYGNSAKKRKIKILFLKVKKEDRELNKTALEELGLGLENRLKSSVEFLSRRSKHGVNF